jgi:Uncharacterized protein involved in biosynthesis of c-type cytochromes
MNRFIVMGRVLVLTAMLGCVAGSWADEAKPLAEDPAVEKRLLDISGEMRCLVCQNESLAASQADLAKDLRQEIREQIQKGMSDQQITDYMVARYGDFVRYRPPVKPSTWALWFGPFLLLLGAVVLLGWVLRHRILKRPPDIPLSVDDKQKIEALLRDQP